MPFHWWIIFAILVFCGIIGIGWPILQNWLYKLEEDKIKTQ
jgi:hypothetical protein